MKKNLLFIFFAILSMSVFAQSVLTITPNPSTNVYQDVDLTDNWIDLVSHATITNNSDQEVQVKWTRTNVDMPAAWESQICDKNNCYDTSVSSNINPGGIVNVPVVLAPGEESILDVHVSPRMTAGSGTLTVELATVDNPDEVIESAVFEVTVDGLSSISEVERRRLAVFPNPTTDYIKIAGNPALIDRVAVYNLLGRQVRDFDVNVNNEYRLDHLPDGMYLVSLISEENGVLKTLRVNKRNFRP